METFFLDFIKYIPSIAVVIAAFWALYLFRKQQRFKRLQNLSSLWKEFAKDDDNMHLFNLMNQIESDQQTKEDLASFDSISKLRYLALVEEVALYVENFEVDKDYAHYLFQWHFYFIYQSSKTSGLFWNNLGAEEEMNQKYWSKSRELSNSFLP